MGLMVSSCILAAPPKFGFPSEGALKADRSLSRVAVVAVKSGI